MKLNQLLDLVAQIQKNTVASVESNLHCLIYATSPEHQAMVLQWLSVSKRITALATVGNHAALRKQLAVEHYHLLVFVASSRDQVLPACLLRYPETRTLVITNRRKVRDYVDWCQQGATDIVSLQKPELVQHALSRLIDERQQSVRLANMTAKNMILQQQLDALSDQQPPSNSEIAANTRTIATDSVTGLPARSTLLEHFENLLKTQKKAKRYTAMLVRVFAGKQHTSESVQADKTLQDLSLYRAANLLQQRVSAGSLLGRVNDNALLLIQPADAANGSRVVANQIRRTLGSLGGLVESATDVRIDTLNLSASSISASEAVERLEAR